MDNYEAFKGFLDKEGFTYNEDVLNGGERLLRIPQRLQSGDMVSVVFLFAQYKIKLAILGIATVEEEDKKLACYKLFNEFNKEYAFFKIYLRPDGGICVDADFSLDLVKGEFQTREFMSFAAMAMHAVEKFYQDIKKIQLS